MTKIYSDPFYGPITGLRLRWRDIVQSRHADESNVTADRTIPAIAGGEETRPRSLQAPMRSRRSAFRNFNVRKVSIAKLDIDTLTSKILAISNPVRRFSASGGSTIRFCFLKCKRWQRQYCDSASCLRKLNLRNNFPLPRHGRLPPEACCRSSISIIGSGASHSRQQFYRDSAPRTFQ
jgi:hypothetical protein